VETFLLGHAEFVGSYFEKVGASEMGNIVWVRYKPDTRNY